MKKLIRSLCIGYAICTISCSIEDSNEVQIRVKNVSTYLLNDFTIAAGTVTHNYGDLEDGQASEYVTYDYAYESLFIKFSIDGESWIRQPVDHVGETKLSSGRYRLEIDVNDFGSQFQLVNYDIIKD